MSEGYQRLQAVASAVASEIRGVEQDHSIISAAGLVAPERRPHRPAVKRFLQPKLCFCCDS